MDADAAAGILITMSLGGAGPSAYDDVLDTGASSRFGPWAAVAVVALFVLGWQLRGVEAPPSPVEVAVAGPTAATSTAAAPTGTATAQWGADIVTDVRFVDDRTGFALMQVCSPEAAAAFGCGRRLLVTGDGGASWDAVRSLPTMAHGHDTFLAVSADVVMVLDSATLSGVVRSTDGGLSWVRLPVTRAGPLPLTSSGYPILTDPVICNRRCEPTTVSWFDPASLSLHPLPTQPAASELARSEFNGVSTIDGDVVVGGTTLTGAYVAMSRDGGQTWSQTRVEPDLGPGQAVTGADMRAAGGGRAYVFVETNDGTSEPATFGYRTDDGGASWLPLPLEGQPFLGWPHAVFDGELLATDQPGHVLFSAEGGTTWEGVSTAPLGMQMAQHAPDGAVVGRLWRAKTLAEHYLSVDGHRWLRMRLPA